MNKLIACCTLFASVITAWSAENYVVAIKADTYADVAWKAVADALVVKHGGKLVIYKNNIEEQQGALQKQGARYLAIVAKPQDIDPAVVRSFHRLTRRIDEDPYGDCMWGIITGYTAQDALRIAQYKEPLTVTRAGGTTVGSTDRFADFMYITDWAPFCTLERHNLGEPQKKEMQGDPEKGMIPEFNRQWKEINPQFLVTSSHATQYNLEMPFGKGVIVSYDNRFHLLGIPGLKEFAKMLSGPQFKANEQELSKLLNSLNPQAEVLETDNSTARVWLAMGNCLIGDTKKSRHSMVVTAMSSYGFYQFVGYTVPTWYGKGGGGVHDLFLNNHDLGTLAESWYMNNQVMLDNIICKYPALKDMEWNPPDTQDMRTVISSLVTEIVEAGIKPEKENVGLMYDKDVVAFYGDPAWEARLDESHEQSPWHITWGEDKSGKTLTITANKSVGTVCAIWFPKRLSSGGATLKINGKETTVESVGVLTNDFLLLRSLSLEKGQKAELFFPAK